jgi:hypothetical protein
MKAYKFINKNLTTIPSFGVYHQWKVGKFFISKCPPRKGMPKTHTIHSFGKGFPTYYIMVSVRERRGKELRRLLRTDILPLPPKPKGMGIRKD